MRISVSWLERQTACFLAILLVVPLGNAATPLSGSVAPAAVASGTGSPDEGRATQLVAQAAQSAPLPNDPGTTGAQHVDQNQPAADSAPSSGNQAGSAQSPVGTAAAPYVKPEGVVASSPAGAAIAPGKQRRIHSIAIRVGLLVGAGVAIGVVVATSLGSQSRPH